MTRCGAKGFPFAAPRRGADRRGAAVAGRLLSCRSVDARRRSACARAGRSGQGRGDAAGRRRLCPAHHQAGRRCRFAGDGGRPDHRDPLQAPGGNSGRQACRCGAGLCFLRARRSRWRRDPAVAGAQGHHQHHDGGRAGVRRSVARRLERRAAGPAGRKWSANCPNARAPPSGRCGCSGPTRKPRSRRCGCAPRCSRPSCASCSKCPTVSASPRC